MEGTPDLKTFARRWQILLLVGGFVVIAAILVTIYFLVVRQPYVVLFKDLRSSDAATIVAELDKRKVPYELQNGGQIILAPRKVVDATRLAIMNEDLPLKGVVGFELFSKSDMGLTEFAQRINYRRALQGEIARTLMGLQDVESARVHLSISEPAVFRDDRKPSKASVAIIPRRGHTLSQQTVRGMQRLVAAAVPDLEPYEVVVLGADGEILSSTDAASLSIPAALQETAAIEEFYASRVRLALRALLPEDRVAVTVKAGWPGPAEQQAVGQDPYGAWTPQARGFPLHLTITLKTPLGPQSLTQARELAAQAVGLDERIGDTVAITFAPSPGSMIAEPTPSPLLQRAPLSHVGQNVPPPAKRLAVGIAIPFMLLIVLLGLAGFLHRLRPPSGRLSSRERDKFAGELNKLLVKREGASATAQV